MSNSRVRRGFSSASGSGMIRSHTSAETPIASLMAQLPVDSTRPSGNPSIDRSQQNLFTSSNAGVVRYVFVIEIIKNL